MAEEVINFQHIPQISKLAPTGVGLKIRHYILIRCGHMDPEDSVQLGELTCSCYSPSMFHSFLVFFPSGPSGHPVYILISEISTPGLQQIIMSCSCE